MMRALLFSILIFSTLAYGQTSPQQQSYYIRGCVLDYVTHKPVSGTIVSILQENVSDTTDESGTFYFQLTQDLTGKQVRLHAQPNPLTPDAIVMNEEIIFDSSFANKDFIFYRYPKDPYYTAKIKAYKRPLVFTSDYQGDPTIVTQKENTERKWHFRLKRKKHEKD
jgi:hypothetical protein